MNVFPTRILVASDGSESAAHATEVAVELSKKTHSELHVLYVGEEETALLYPQAADKAWVVQEDLAPIEEQRQQFEQVARQTLDAEVQNVRAVGGTVAQAHLRMGTPAAEIVVVLGSGQRLFRDGIEETALKLVGTDTFDTGVVVLTYRPAEKELRDKRSPVRELER